MISGFAGQEKHLIRSSRKPDFNLECINSLWQIGIEVEVLNTIPEMERSSFCTDHGELRN